MLLKCHQTVAAIIERENRFLMVKEHTKDGIKINQPAGHLEAEESLINAVKRETREETAYDFVPRSLLGIYKWENTSIQETFIRYAFIGTINGEKKNLPLDNNIIDAIWLTADQITARENHRSILVSQCLQDYLGGVSYPLEIINEVTLEHAKK